MDIMAMMVCFIVDMARVNPLAQPIHLVILLVLELTMPHTNSFSRIYLSLPPFSILFYVIKHPSSFYNLNLSLSLCLIIIASKNGQVVGTVYKDIKGPLFPTIAVHSQNEEYVPLQYYLSHLD